MTGTQNVIQEKLYAEPYHYYVSIDKFSLHKRLSWGLEYYSYIHFLSGIINKNDFESMIDVGCGDGYLINYLSKFHDNKRLKGVDLSNRAITFAKAFALADNVTFECQQLENIDEQFDLVTLVEVLEHIDDSGLPTFVDNLKRIMKPAGTLIVSVPTVNVKLNKKHYRHYDVNLLKSQIPDMKLKEYFYIYNTKSIILKAINKLLCNNYFILNSGKIIKTLIAVANSELFVTNENEGAHLIAVFKNN